MANLQNVLRGLQVLGSYSKFIVASVNSDDDDASYIHAGPYRSILHPNEKSILESNHWFIDESIGFWTIDVSND